MHYPHLKLPQLQVKQCCYVHLIHSYSMRPACTAWSSEIRVSVLVAPLALHLTKLVNSEGVFHCFQGDFHVKHPKTSFCYCFSRACCFHFDVISYAVHNVHSSFSPLLPSSLPPSLPPSLCPFVPLSLPPSLSLLLTSEIDSLIHAMNLVNSVDKLVEVCEAPSTVRMPRTVHLVKQLRKELNFSDVVKSYRKEGEVRDGEREGARGEE